MLRSYIPQRASLFIIGISILQLISLFLPYRGRWSTIELGFEQQTLVFFFIASSLLFVTLYVGQKRFFILSLLTSIVFVWPSYYSFLVGGIYYPFMMGGYAPLLGAIIYLFGIISNFCILLYWWWNEKHISPEATKLTPLEWRTLGFSVYFFSVSSLIPSHPINLALEDFFPFLKPLLVLIDHPLMICFIIFLGQFISGLWLISNHSQSLTFSKKAIFTYLVKIGLLWFMLGLIISCLSENFESELFLFFALSVFLFTVFLILMELITWVIGFHIRSSSKPLFQYLERKIRFINSLILPKINKTLSVPEIRFIVVLFLGYLLGAYLIQYKLLNPFLDHWRATEVIYIIKYVLVSLIWVLIAQIISLNNVTEEKIASVTRNNFLLFLIVQQLSFWEGYLVYWIFYEELGFENVLNYIQSVLLGRVLELFVIFTFFYLFAFIWKKNLSLKSVDG